MDMTMTKPRRSGAVCQGRLTYRSSARLTTSETVSSRSCALARAAAHRSSGMRIARGVSGMCLAPIANAAAEQRRINDPLLHVSEGSALTARLGGDVSRKGSTADCHLGAFATSGDDVKGAAVPTVDVVCVAHGLAFLASPLGCIYRISHACIYSQVHSGTNFPRVAGDAR